MTGQITGGNSTLSRRRDPLRGASVGPRAASALFAARCTICVVFAACCAVAWWPEGAAAMSPKPVPKGLGINRRLNLIQYADAANGAALVKLFDRAQKDGLRILHLGDSHVQYGMSTASMRAELQARYGNGGFGLVFPFAIANTYSPAGYSSEFTGEWKCSSSRHIPPSVPLGVMGIACQTADPAASYTIRFNRKQPSEQRLLRIIVQRYDTPYTFEVDSGSEKAVVTVEPSSDTKAGQVVEVTLETAPDVMTFRPIDGISPEKPFVTYGLSVENADRGGVVCDSAGVGASRFRAILHEDRFPAQVAAFRPDIVILDWGTNDYLKKPVLDEDLESVVRRVIGIVRKAAPGALIVVTSAHDLYWKKRAVPAGLDFASLIRTVSAGEKVMWWDWFWVAGGPMSMARWMRFELTQTDGVHLNAAGYRLKGMLLADAFVDTTRWIKSHRKAKSLVIKPPKRGFPRSGHSRRAKSRH